MVWGRATWSKDKGFGRKMCNIGNNGSGGVWVGGWEHEECI